MIISFREKYLIKNAESPNAYPWNVSPSSHFNKGEEEMPNQNEALPQKIVDLKIDKRRHNVDKYRQLLDWEVYNQFSQEVLDERSEDSETNEENN